MLDNLTVEASRVTLVTYLFIERPHSAWRHLGAVIETKRRGRGWWRDLTAPTGTTGDAGASPRLPLLGVDAAPTGASVSVARGHLVVAEYEARTQSSAGTQVSEARTATPKYRYYLSTAASLVPRPSYLARFTALLCSISNVIVYLKVPTTTHYGEKQTCLYHFTCLSVRNTCLVYLTE